jgi:hypothetical protein
MNSDGRVSFQRRTMPALGARTIPELTDRDIDKLRAKLKKESHAPLFARSFLTLAKRQFSLVTRVGYGEYPLANSMPSVDHEKSHELLFVVGAVKQS